MTRLGAAQQKILVLLLGAMALSLAPASPGQVHRVMRSKKKDFRGIDRQNLHRTLEAIRQKKLIRLKKNGKYFIPVLTRVGRKQAEIYKMSTLKIPRPKMWDGRWRVVMFDIHEDDRKLRNFFRAQLKRLQFCELQKRVFVTPYPCRRQMERLSTSYEK